LKPDNTYPETAPALADMERHLESLKRKLWHGNVPHALQRIDDLDDDLEMLEENPANKKKILKAVKEFRSYIWANQSFIPNYGDRYRHDETISTAFVESTVNYVVNKRFVKNQQMRWTRRGTHLLLQTRAQVLNDDLRKTFSQWYPGMKDERVAQKAAALCSAPGLFHSPSALTNGVCSILNRTLLISQESSFSVFTVNGWVYRACPRTLMLVTLASKLS